MGEIIPMFTVLRIKDLNELTVTGTVPDLQYELNKWQVSFDYYMIKNKETKIPSIANLIFSSI